MKTIAAIIQVKTTRALAAVSLALLLFLPACGGGSSGESPAPANDPCAPNNGSTACQPGIASRPANSSCLAPAISTVDNTVTLTRILPNISFSQPTKALQAPGDSSHWYVVELGGTIKRVVNNSATTSAPNYLSLSVSSGGERGLLGMAFSPDWPATKEIYVYYTFNSGSLESRVSRLQITNDSTLPASFTEQVLLSIDQPFSNHNGGEIAFGSDGYLYISTGDGGSGGDPQNHSQNTTDLLGNMLRIDVNGIAYPSPGYQIPASNPFSGNAKCGPGSNAADCPEIYAWGLRNPWRWSFDSQSDTLWLGDVGQNAWEEIDIVKLGDNLGWRCKEGNTIFNSTDCNLASLVDPVHVYPHSDGNVSVTGGFVYRGSNMPDLLGHYLFADFNSGRIWSLSGNSTMGYSEDELLDSSHNISAFAQDTNGELYILSYFSGAIYQLQAGSSTGGSGVENDLADTGCVLPANPSQPASGLIPYQPNAQFWSDNADKQRWLALPDGTTIDASDDQRWEFPNGTVTIKNFVVENQLVETRLFMRHHSGEWAGYSYEWDEAETTATRVTGSKVRNLIHTAAPQQWIYPSEGECLQCHTAAAGYVLGIDTPQLNSEFSYPDSGLTDNQLETFNHIDLFTVDVTEPVTALPAITDPNNTAEALLFRAKGYLDTNCASCHQPGGGTPANIDLRFETPLANMGICDIDPLLSDLGIGGAKLIAPGSPANSVLVQRMNRRDSDGMPPIGSNLIDTAGVQLIEQWISDLSHCN